MIQNKITQKHYQQADFLGSMITNLIPQIKLLGFTLPL